MAQAVAVVNASLTATGGGTTDITSSGFGTPTAAIIIASQANSTNNPQSGAGLSIGFWDGTNQCSHGFYSSDALGTSGTWRTSRNDYAVVIPTSSTGWVVGYQASGITDGIRLTLAVDNTGAQRYATVILLKGVSAKIARLVLNSTVNGTAATGSLGFAPTAALMCSSGYAGNTANSGSTQLATALLSFGAAQSSGTHRMLAWCSSDASATADVTALYSETRSVAQVVSGSESWSAEVTTWGADTITMTSRTAGSGGDDVDILCLGGADLSLLLGTLTTATSTGSADVTTTGIDPDAVLLCLGNTSSTTIASDGTASGISVGVSDGTTHGGYAGVDEDAADTTNSVSAYSSANAVYSRTSASGTASDLVVGAVSMGAEKFSVNYTTVSGTARKGWWLAIGQPSAGSSPTLTTSLSAAVQQAQAMTAGLSAAVQNTPTVSASVAAAVQAARTAQAGLDAAVQQARTGVASVQLAVQAAGVQTASIDAALQLARSATAALDIAVQAQSAATASVSLQVQATNAATASVSLQVQAGSSASVALSVAVLQQALATAGVDLAVQLPGQQTASINAALQAARNAAAAIDMALQLARSAGASVNLQVQAGTSAVAGVDAAVQRATSAVASVQLAIAQAATASLSLGAAVMVQRSVAAAVDALVLGGRSMAANLSLYIADASGVLLAAGRRRVQMPDATLLARSVQMPAHALLRRSVAMYPA